MAERGLVHARSHVILAIDIDLVDSVTKLDQALDNPLLPGHLLRWQAFVPPLQVCYGAALLRQ